MFTKLSFCFCFGAVLFLDLVSFSSADEQKLVDEQKLNNEQKLTDEKKSFDEPFKCKEECIPPSVCLLYECTSFEDFEVPKFEVPQVPIPKNETARSHSDYFYMRIGYKLLLLVLALVACYYRYIRPRCTIPEEIPVEQEVAVTVQYPQPTQDGFQQNLPHEGSYPMYLPPYSANSYYPDPPPSYDDVVKSDPDASTVKS